MWVALCGVGCRLEEAPSGGGNAAIAPTISPPVSCALTAAPTTSGTGVALGGAYAIFGEGASSPAVIGDTNGDGCVDVGVSAGDDAYVYYGPLERKIYTLADADAVIEFDDTELQQLVAAGDTNLDGYADLWVRNGLFLGPLAPVQSGTSPYATVPTPPGSAGFDADGDGFPDVLGYDEGWRSTLYYGPFVGPSLSPADPGFDPWTATVFENRDTECAPLSRISEWLGDLDGDGDGEVRVGGDLNAACDGWSQVWLWSSGSARGRTLGNADAVAWGSSGRFYEGRFAMALPHAEAHIGDVTGDGRADVASVGVLSGPDVVGEITTSTPVALSFVNTTFFDDAGDLDGDGDEELLALNLAEDTLYAIPGGSSGEVDPAAVGWQIAHYFAVGERAAFPRLGSGHGDLDGDGHEELLVTAMTVEGDAEVQVFVPADFLPPAGP